MQYAVNATLLPGYDASHHWAAQLAMNAGHVSVNDETDTETKTTDTLYFWSFHNINANTSTDTNNSSSSSSSHSRSRPFVVWLNGGPGCSSMDGALMEIGPLRVGEDGDEHPTVHWNDDSWFAYADLLFIDQPLGTGFSTSLSSSKTTTSSSFDSTLAQSSKHLLTFLINYFSTFPNFYDQYDDIIIAGESYAGQYIPHLAALMKDHPLFKNKLSAVMLGNAWLDPTLQSLSYVPYALERGLVQPQATAEKDQRKFSILMQYQEACQNARNNGNENVDKICDTILQKMLQLYRTKDHKCINAYDVAKLDSYPSCGMNWPETVDETTTFLNIPQVQQALNVAINGDIVWSECSNDVGSHFQPEVAHERTGAQLLQELLQSGVRVNLFSGMNDLICNYIGSEMVIKEHANTYLSAHGWAINMELHKRDIAKMAMDARWTHDGIDVGAVWQRGNLSYVQVANASHMVPYDHAGASLGLLELVLRNDLSGDEVKTNTPIIEHTPIAEHDEVPLTENNSNSPSNSNSNSHSHSRRLLAMMLLAMVLAGLAYYVYRLLAKRRAERSNNGGMRYSALSGPHSKRYRARHGAQHSYARYALESVAGDSESESAGASAGGESGSGSGNGSAGGSAARSKKKVHWEDQHVQEDVDDFDADLELADLDFDADADADAEAEADVTARERVDFRV